MSLFVKSLPIFEKRAMIYQWFSGLFAKELDDEQFSAYQQGKADKWLSVFEQIGLEIEVSRFKKTIKQWQPKNIDSLDLRADFAELFLLDNKTAAIPYASFYLEKGGQLYGKMEDRMQHFLNQNKLQISTDFKEPADHLAIYLALMNNWIKNCLDNNDVTIAAKEQLDFLQQALLNWLPQFVEKCQNVLPYSNFYASLAQLLLAFIKTDIKYLKNINSE